MEDRGEKELKGKKSEEREKEGTKESGKENEQRGGRKDTIVVKRKIKREVRDRGIKRITGEERQR